MLSVVTLPLTQNMVWITVQSLDFGDSLPESPETVQTVDWYSLELLTCVGVSWHFCTVNQGAPSFHLTLHTLECSTVIAAMCSLVSVPVRV